MYRSENIRRRQRAVWCARPRSGPGPIRREALAIGSQGLRGELVLVPDMVGLVLCAHESMRSHYLASVLQRHRLGTLRVDLLTPAELADGHLVHDIDSLAGRVAMALDQVGAGADTARLPCGLFFAGAAAAAALLAAARWPIRVGAIVSRAGRTELCAPSLGGVQAPTLLIVGANDSRVLEVNRAALKLLRCEKRLEVVPGAGRHFQQPGTLETVAELAAHWLAHHLPNRQAG